MVETKENFQIRFPKLLGKDCLGIVYSTLSSEIRSLKTECILGTI